MGDALIQKVHTQTSFGHLLLVEFIAGKPGNNHWKDDPFELGKKAKTLVSLTSDSNYYDQWAKINFVAHIAFNMIFVINTR